MAFVGDDQSSRALGSKLAVPRRVHHRHHDVAHGQPVAVAIADPPDQRRRRQRPGQHGAPLVKQVTGGDQHRNLATALQFLGSGGNPDHGLASAGDRLDDTASASGAPSGQRFDLPAVKLRPPPRRGGALHCRGRCGV